MMAGFIFIIRRISSVLISIFIKNKPLIQIFFTCWLNFACSIYYAKYLPHVRNQDNFLQLLNEVLFQAITMLMVQLTDYNSDLKEQDQWGWLIIGAIGVLSFFNIGLTAQVQL